MGRVTQKQNLIGVSLCVQGTHRELTGRSVADKKLQSSKASLLKG